MVRELGGTTIPAAGSAWRIRSDGLRPVNLLSGPPVPDGTPVRPVVGAGAGARAAPDPPVFAPALLVLVAAVAIFEGYHWLHLIPGGSERPSEILFLMGIVPVTAVLTRRLEGPGPRALGWSARLLSAGLLLLGIAEATGGNGLIIRALGMSSLALAGVLVALVLVVETAPRRRAGHL